MNREQIDEMVSGVAQTSPFKQLVYRLSRNIRDESPYTALIALQTVMVEIVNVYDAAYAGNLVDVHRFLNIECGPRDRTRNTQSASQTAVESLLTERKIEMAIDEASLQQLQESITSLTDLIRHVTGPTGPLLTAATQLAGQLDEFNKLSQRIHDSAVEIKLPETPKAEESGFIQHEDPPPADATKQADAQTEGETKEAAA